jgi:hypothetical protein
MEAEARAGGWVAQLRVLHLNSAPQGGAGRLAQSLVHAQSEIGVISEIVFGLDGPLRSSPQKAPLLALAAGVDEYLLKKSNSNQQVSLIRSLLSGRLDENWIKSNFDVVHLHWVEGMVSRSEIAKLSSAGLKIVWTLHDMRPITGACHHSGDCSRFENTCSTCPILRSPFSEWAKKSLDESLKHLDGVDISFVAPSHWMKDKAQASRIMQGRNVTLIPNSIESRFLDTPQSIEPRNQNILFIANNLADPNKGFSEIALWAGKTDPKPRIVAVGANSEKFGKIDGINFLGPLPTDALIGEMDKSSYLVINSENETAPLIVAEAAARGLIPIIPGHLKSRIDPNLIRAGCLFFNSANEIQIAIQELKDGVAQEALRSSLKIAAKQTHHPASIARKYQDVYLARN